MQIDEKKLARQELGVDRWFENKCVGIADYHPGTGKTYLAILAIKRLEKIERGSYIIIVPSSELEKQWNKILASQFPKHLIERIIVKTVHTLLLENIVYETKTVIVDEVHEFHTEERISLINRTKIKFDYFLALTGSSDDKNFWIIKRHYKIFDHISAQEAKEEGYVSDFVEYNLALTLTKGERELYDDLTERISKMLPRFQNELSLAQKVLSGGKDKNGRYYSGAGFAYSLARKNGWSTDLNLQLETHRQIDLLWNPSNFIGYARSLINSIRNRKKLLCTCNSKYNATLELINKFDKVKTIIFSENTDFANKIGKILNENNHPAVVYHSNLPTIIRASPKTQKPTKFGKERQKKEAVEAIKTGKARIMCTAKSLDRGFDVEDLRFSITASGSQNPTQYKQRAGRTGRKEKGIFADLPVLNVNLFILDTKDEIWLKNRQSKSNHKPIVVNSVEDINYIPPSNVEFTLNDL